MSPERADLFLEAQDRVWPAVTAELRNGRKTSHWIWFVFPQLAVLGRSPTAQRFGIRDLDEAAEYLAHPALRARLIEAAGLVLTHKGQDVRQILGTVDAMKLRSSMTLFAAVPAAPDCFAEVLAEFYAGTICRTTSQFIGAAA